MNLEERQQKALDYGFKYWRAPDSHGCTCNTSEAILFMQDMLGVEVSIEDSPKRMEEILGALKELVASEKALAQAGLNGTTAMQGEATLRHIDALKVASNLIKA